jgi:hypothetical protein
MRINASELTSKRLVFASVGAIRRQQHLSVFTEQIRHRTNPSWRTCAANVAHRAQLYVPMLAS